MNKTKFSQWATFGCVFSTVTVLAQSGPPPLPPISSADLNSWTLTVRPWNSVYGDPAKAFTGLNVSPSWGYEGTCLSVDTNVPAYLQLNVFEDDWTNITLNSGSLEIWCQANWTSVADGGSGPGAWATLWDIGFYTRNASIGAWLLTVDPPGSNLVWVAQSGGTNQILWTPINFDAGDWHQIVATWSPSNACLYVDGALATNSGPILYGPSDAECAADGFCVGSLSASGTNAGMHQFHGQLQWLASYSYPLSAAEVAAEFANVAGYISYSGYCVPGDGAGFHPNLDDPMEPPGDGGTNSGGGMPEGSPSGGYSAPSYSETDFWLESLPLGTNAFNLDSTALTLLLHGTTNMAAYQLLSTTNLQTPYPDWTVETTFVGSETTNFTPVIVSLAGRPQLFFRALNYSFDSDGDGLPDWWEIQSGLDPNNADTGNTGVPDGYKQDSAGDGYSNLQKFQMGILGNVFTPPPGPGNFTALLNSNQTSASLAWQTCQGDVQSYLPQTELLDFCKQKGIVLLAFAPLGHGIRPGPLEDPAVLAIARQTSLTPAQVLLAWAIQRGTAVLTTAKTLDRARENYNISAIPEAAVDEINRIQIRSRLNPVTETGVPGFIAKGG